MPCMKKFIGILENKLSYNHYNSNIRMKSIQICLYCFQLSIQFCYDNNMFFPLGMLKKVSQNVNVISQRLTLMESRMGKLESGHMNVNGGETQLAILSEIAKYFPIDTDDKLLIIEEKLATKNFFLDVVSSIEIRIFLYFF